MSKEADYFTRQGAKVLAARIFTYWQRHGYAGIVTDIQPMPGSPDAWVVKSNMVDGWPPK